MNTLYAATAHGLIFIQGQGGTWREAGGALTGQRFTSIAARGSDLLAGSQEGLYRSADGGRTWWGANEGLGERHIRSVALHPDDAALAHAGTEPAAIYRSTGAGGAWHECPEVARLRDAGGWYLPYSPRAGAIRGLAFEGRRGYAAAEQGGLLRSDDRGQTWRMAAGSSGQVDVYDQEGHIHPDVHSVLIHPSSPDQVLAPTGGGFYYSANGGARWERLHPDYCRAVWVDPLRPTRLLLGTADGPDRRGRILESLNGGRTWQPAEGGLRVPMARHMVEHFVQAGGDLLAVLSNGELIGAALDGLQWQTILPPDYRVRAVAPLPDIMSQDRPTNQEIARVLDGIADLLEAQGANPYRVRAYSDGASQVRTAKESLADMTLAGGEQALTRLPGIGPALAGVIDEYVKTGRSELLVRLQTEIMPAAVFAQIPGLGDDLAQRIVDELDVRSLEELEQAAHDGRLEQVPGFGPQRVRLVQTSLAGIFARPWRSQGARPTGPSSRPHPSVDLLLAVDAEYRERAAAGELRRIAPRRFNPGNEAWLPVLEDERDGWQLTALFSNTARAHDLGKTDDWVVIYYEREDQRAQATVVTDHHGPLEGRRVVRGREAETRDYYERRPPDRA